MTKQKLIHEVDEAFQFGIASSSGRGRGMGTPDKQRPSLSHGLLNLFPSKKEKPK